MYCPTCGRSIKSIGRTKQGYCLSCGLVHIGGISIKDSISDTKYCSYCNKELPRYLNYCLCCGKNVKQIVKSPKMVIPTSRSY